MIKKIKLISMSALVIAAPLAAVSCSAFSKSSFTENSIKPDGKVNISVSTRDVLYEEHTKDDDFNQTKDDLGFGSITYLSNRKYNQIYRMIHKDEVGIVVISNHHIYKEFIKTDGSKTMLQLIQNAPINFKTKMIDQFLGAWIATFKAPGMSSWAHGTSTQKNYGDYYPLFFVNHIYSQFGASNFHPEGKDLIEISYDHY